MPYGWCAAESDPAGVFSLQAVYQAYRACRRGKRGARETQRYELRLLDHLIETREALVARCWSPARSVAFITLRPKAREIHAAPFADRVVHHLLVSRLEALYEPRFIHDSYANRHGKGTHAAVERLQHFQRQLTHNGRRRAWFLQLDIRNFFYSIHRPRLLGLLRRRLDQSRVRGELATAEVEPLDWLCATILGADPMAGCIRVGDPRRFRQVPLHKRLDQAPPETGLPIGNLTSQFFGNVYLNELDQFVKHVLKCRHYLRYVDDFVLLHSDPDLLRIWRDSIAEFLRQRLGLQLKDPGRLAPVSQGVDFLGYIVRPGYRLVRRRVLGHLRDRLRLTKQRLHRPLSGGIQQRLTRPARERLRAGLASALGHGRHACFANGWRRVWQAEPWLADWFCSPPCLPWWRPGRGRGARIGLIPRWEPASVSSLRGQWRYFRLQGDELVLMQVGNRVEAYGVDVIRLRVLRPRARPASRPGFSEVFCLPLKALVGLRQQLRRQGIAHCFIAEEGYLRSGRKRRVLRLIWRPLSAAFPLLSSDWPSLPSGQDGSPATASESPL